MKRELGILMVAVGLVAGCGSKGNSCVPGQSTACVCSDGSAGAQVCGGDGAYGACACGATTGVGGNGGGSGSGSGGSGGGGGAGGGGGGGGGGTGGGGGSGGGGGANQAAPFTIKNASARNLGSGSYNITFVLENPNAAQGVVPKRIDVIRLKWDSTMLSDSIGCASSPWITNAETSDVITVGLYITASSGTRVATTCGSGFDTNPLGGAVPLPIASIGVELDGIMPDATPFSVSATAPVL